MTGGVPISGFSWRHQIWPKALKTGILVLSTIFVLYTIQKESEGEWITSEKMNHLLFVIVFDPKNVNEYYRKDPTHSGILMMIVTLILSMYCHVHIGSIAFVLLTCFLDKHQRYKQAPPASDLHLNIYQNRCSDWFDLIWTCHEISGVDYHFLPANFDRILKLSGHVHFIINFWFLPGCSKFEPKNGIKPN